MDTPQPAPDPRRERKQIIFGILITALVFGVAIWLFTLMLMKSGGRGDYYNDIMQRDEERSSAGR